MLQPNPRCHLRLRHPFAAHDTLRIGQGLAELGLVNKMESSYYIPDASMPGGQNWNGGLRHIQG